MRTIPLHTIPTQSPAYWACYAMWAVVLTIDAIGGYLVYWMFT